ncbi:MULTISPECIES: AtzG-like protein [unclassified Roseateles]|uniref:AtzG-like protein n=1 Tax=unclassified Roseateles TaxID=2626991 RepID=UPI0006F624A4|nr:MULTISPECIES: AtzG-like protein [unclassified Roseateles]KQW44653.1 hypothetical protein ASC81_13760 [Pelomonas sp. Root405]KRA70012.1 hypothetical protein ASD88_17920 [Pelomonas sp. Root662]
MNAARIEAYVDAAAAALDLPLAPEHRPGVLRYFGLAAEMAALVNGLPLAVHDEPAEAFAPISP